LYSRPIIDQSADNEAGGSRRLKIAARLLSG